MKIKHCLAYGMASAMLFVFSLGLVGCNNDDDPTEKQPSEEKENMDAIKAVLEEVFSEATTEPQTVTTVNQLATLTCICYTNDGQGPITVTPARLNGEEITLVTLGGTEFVDGQATSIEESTLASYGETNDYIEAVVKLFKNGTVPQGKPVLVTGISLGGMIAQQVLGAPYIMENYQIKAVITYGSPITKPYDRQGVPVIRFADVHDMVPVLGILPLRAGEVTEGMTRKEIEQFIREMDRKEEISRSGKYKRPLETHLLSYIEDECWGDVDFMGDADKTNVLELTADMTYYPAPKLGE